MTSAFRASAQQLNLGDSKSDDKGNIEKILSILAENSEIDPRLLCLMDVGNLEDKVIPRASKGVQTSEDHIASRLISPEDKMNCLKLFPLFRKFSDAALGIMGNSLVEKTIKEGEFICCPGDNGGCIIFLMFGKVFKGSISLDYVK
jgi:hypothetical protein